MGGCLSWLVAAPAAAKTRHEALRVEFLLDWGVITIPVRNLFRQVGVAVDSWQVVNHLLEFRYVRRIASTLVLELSCIISLLLDRVHQRFLLFG